MRISVIMPVHLSHYQSIPETEEQFVITCAPDPEYKFTRAVNSFILQSFKDCELIIISDGCRIAEGIYKKYYTPYRNIRFKYIDKQPLYGGAVRQTGINMAKGEIICYLDHDDMFGNDHLQIISDNFDTKKYDWVYYDDYEANGDVVLVREVLPEATKIGTSSISHKRSLKIKWGDKYGHDWLMIKNYLLPNKKCTKITIPLYYVSHHSNINVNK